MAQRRRVVASDRTSSQTGCRSAGATRPSRTQNKPDGETVRRVVRPLAALRERPDGGDPPADQRQVQRRDRHATDGTPGGLASVRHGGGHDRRPADRDREMNGHRGSQQHRCTPLIWEQHRAGGAAPLQHVLASDQRPRRGGDRRTRRSSQPGCQRVAQEPSSKTTPHTTIVSGSGRLLQPPKRLSSREHSPGIPVIVGFFPVAGLYGAAGSSRPARNGSGPCARIV
jgi:hypothetical protein